MKKYLKELNKEQRLAAEHENGPCMVLAGPGTGKTTVITARVCQLMDKKIAEPDEILVVTFSKAAANEMKSRFMSLWGGSREAASKVCFGTFHSVFFRILKQYKSYKLENLIEETQKYNIIKSIARKMNMDFCEDDEQIGEIIREISYVANTLTSPEDYEPESCRSSEFRRIMNAYCSLKQDAGKFDYDDMLTDCYDLLRSNLKVIKEVRNRYRHVLIDEFQDINPVQFEAIKLIAEPVNNIFVVGDDDQSIYGFRGATPDILMYFERLYPSCKKVFLRNNYRTTGSILSAAMCVIDNNGKRFAKELETVRDRGNVPVVFEVEDFEEESKVIAKKILKSVQDGISYSDIAVIFRTNLQSRAIIDAFMDHNIPFRYLDNSASVYNHWVSRDILAYLRLSQGSRSTREFLRIVNKPRRFISREAMEKADGLDGDFLYNLATYTGLNNLQVKSLNELQGSIRRIGSLKPADAVKFIRGVIGYDAYLREYSASKGINIRGLFEVLEELYSSAEGFSDISDFIEHVEEVEQQLSGQYAAHNGKEQVELLTMHRAKGLEFHTVFIAGAAEGLSPYSRGEKCKADELEEERRLFYVAMTRAKNNIYISVPKYRYKKKVLPSRFIKELEGAKRDYGNNLSIGQKLYHKIYELGVIEELKEHQGGLRAVVDFNGSRKVLDVKHCLQKDIIKIL